MPESNTNPTPFQESHRAFDINVRGNVEMLFTHPDAFPPQDDLAVNIQEITATLSDVEGFPPNVESALEKLEKMESDEAVIDRVCAGITASIRHTLIRNRLGIDGRD